MLAKTEAKERQQYERNADIVEEYHMFGDEVFYTHRSKGLPLPNPAPHPDDVRFYAATGNIIITGPTSEEASLKWEPLYDKTQSFDTSIEELHRLAADPENADIKHRIDDDIAFQTDLRDRLRAALKGWRKRS